MGMADTNAVSRRFSLDEDAVEELSRPIPGDPLAVNDHSDWRWDENVLGSLAGLSRSLRPIGDRLADDLTRFARLSGSVRSRP